MFVKLLILQLFLSSNCLFGKKKHGSEAEQLLLSYKDEYLWTIVSSADGTHIASRACFLQYNKDLGWYIIAKNHTKKYEQLKANPYVTLSLAKVKDNSIPVFYATVRVSTEKADINKAWFAKLKDAGYTGKDDPRIVVFIFTIHGAKLGKTKYEGEAYDYTSLNVVGDAPLPPQPVGPYQSDEGLTVLADAWKKEKHFHLLTYSGLKIHDRLIQLNYNNKTGFYIVTTASSDKVAQLTGNPNVGLLQEQRGEGVQVVVDGLLLPIKCNKSKELTWNDSFKAYNYEGWEDPNYAAYKLVVRKIIVHSLKEDPKTYQFEPTAYDNATEVLYKAVQAYQQWSLATVDERNEPHSRTMVLKYHSALGFYLGGNNASNKYKELAFKSAAALNAYVATTGDDYQVQINTRVLNCDPVRQAIKSATLKAINYNGSAEKSQDVFQDKKTLAQYLPFVINIKSLKHLPPKTSGLPPTVYKICTTNGTGAGAENLVKPWDAVDPGLCLKGGEEGKACENATATAPGAAAAETGKEKEEKGKKKKGADSPAPPPPPPPPAAEEKKAEEVKAGDPAAPPPPAAAAEPEKKEEEGKKGKKKK